MRATAPGDISVVISRNGYIGMLRRSCLQFLIERGGVAPKVLHLRGLFACNHTTQTKDIATRAKEQHVTHMQNARLWPNNILAFNLRWSVSSFLNRAILNE